MRLQLLGQRVLGGEAAAQLDDGVHPLAPLVVGDPEHGRVGHGRVLAQRLLDLDRVDVHAARDDHVRGPVREVDEAVGVDVADVAEGVGARTPERRRRLRLVAVVVEDLLDARVAAPQHAVGPHRELVAALVGHDHLVARDRSAHGAGVRPPGRRVHQGDHAALAAAPVLDEDVPPPVQDPLLDRHRDWGRAVQDRVQRGRVERRAPLLVEVQQPHEHRGDEVRVAHRPLLDQRQGLLGVEALHDHQRRALVQVHEGEPHGCGVVQRPGHEVGAVAVQAQRPPRRGDGEQLRAERRLASPQHALGPARRPRRVEHRAACRTGGIGRMVRRAGHETVEVPVHHHDLHVVAVEPAQGLAHGQLEAGFGHDHAGARVLEHVGDLFGGEVPVDRGQGDAGAGRADEQLDELDAVREQHRRVCTARHAQRARPQVGDPVRPVVELGPGASTRAVVEGRLVTAVVVDSEEHRLTLGRLSDRRRGGGPGRPARRRRPRPVRRRVPHRCWRRCAGCGADRTSP